MPNGNEPTESEWSSLGWAEWKGRFGAKMEAVEKGQTKLFELFGESQTAMMELREELGKIKGKAAAYGAVSGTIITLVLAVIMYASKPKETASPPPAKAKVTVNVEQRSNR